MTRGPPLTTVTGMRTSIRTGLAATAILAAAALAGCTQLSGASTVVDQPVPAPAEGWSAGDSGGGSPGVVDADRSIITTGRAAVLVEDPIASADEAARIADEAGGRIDARTEQAPTESDGGRSSITLRVPADELDATVDAIKALGESQSVTIDSTDVTMQSRDLDARIGALTAAITRLTDLLAQASSTTDLIAIEQAITDRQSELDSLTAQQRSLEDQVTMSTLTVDFVTEPVIAKPAPGTFLDGLVAGWEALSAFAAGLLVVLGAFIPWLIPLAIIAAVVWLVLRARRRRREAPTS